MRISLNCNMNHSDEPFLIAIHQRNSMKKDISMNVRLQLYGLYMQANFGNYDKYPELKPWFFQFYQRSKWKAWRGYFGFSKTLSQKLYILTIDEERSKKI